MVIRQQQLRRLQRVEVEGLFGIYNHRIESGIEFSGDAVARPEWSG